MVLLLASFALISAYAVLYGAYCVRMRRGGAAAGAFFLALLPLAYGAALLLSA